MKHRFCPYALLLLSACYMHVLQADQLADGLVQLRKKLTGLAEKISFQEPIGNQQDDNSVHNQQDDKPEPSDSAPMFTKVYLFQYGRTVADDAKLFKVGIVKVATDLYNLVIYGPKLTDAEPKDFIFEKMLVYPYEKAKKLIWDSAGKILAEGPLASFTLVSGEEKKKFKEQEGAYTQELNKKIEPLTLELGSLENKKNDAKDEKKVAAYVQEMEAFFVKINGLFGPDKLHDIGAMPFPNALKVVKLFLEQVSSFFNARAVAIKEEYDAVSKTISYGDLNPSRVAKAGTFKKARESLSKAIELLKALSKHVTTQEQKIEALLDNPLEKLYQALLVGSVKMQDYWKSERQPPTTQPVTIVSDDDDNDDNDDNNDEAIEQLKEELLNNYKVYKAKNTIAERTEYAKTVQDKLDKYMSDGGKDKVLVEWRINMRNGIYHVPPFI